MNMKYEAEYEAEYEYEAECEYEVWRAWNQSMNMK